MPQFSFTDRKTILVSFVVTMIALVHLIAGKKKNKPGKDKQ